ncbi:MAG: helical backbone metal receptor [Acidobacteriota bacterium]
MWGPLWTQRFDRPLARRAAFSTPWGWRGWWESFGLSLVVLFVLTACRDHADVDRSSQASRPQRIISLSPNVTEILAGVNAFERVIAVSDYCDFPPGVDRLPRVGSWQTASLEQLTSLTPDLVIIARPQAALVESKLVALGYRILVVDGLNLQDVFDAIGLIGEATGNAQEAQALIESTKETLDAVQAKTRGAHKPRVLCVVDRLPGTLRDLYASSEGSFLTELIAIAGGDPVAPPASGGYVKISKEAVLVLDPEIIIDMVQAPQGRFGEDPASVWKELSEVRAVREGRVYPIRETSVLHPSQFVADTARRFARLIHPEVVDYGSK